LHWLLPFGLVWFHQLEVNVEIVIIVLL
jgi:hypothetical protein